MLSKIVKLEHVMVVGASLLDDLYGGKKNWMRTILVRKVDKCEWEKDY